MSKNAVDVMSDTLIELQDIEDIKSVSYELEFKDGHKISQKITKPEIAETTKINQTTKEEKNG